MDATQVNLHKVIGPMLIGAWLNLMLFVLVINQALYYFHHYPIDRILVKIAVCAVLVCDMGTIIAGCADAYMEAVTFQGNIGALQMRHWPRSLDLAFTGISASIVQAFMLHRYWSLTRRKALTSAVALVILSSLASTLYLTTVVILFQSEDNSLHTQLLPASILWLSTAMVADLLIALLMVLYYRATDVDRTFRSSYKLIHRLAALALKTGSFTALIAVVTLVTFVIDIQSNVTMIFGYCIGSIYSLTLFYNLNIRRKLFNRTYPGDLLYIRVPDLERRSRVTIQMDVLSVESRSQRSQFVSAASIHT